MPTQRLWVKDTEAVADQFQRATEVVVGRGRVRRRRLDKNQRKAVFMVGTEPIRNPTVRLAAEIEEEHASPADEITIRALTVPGSGARPRMLGKQDITGRPSKRQFRRIVRDWLKNEVQILKALQEVSDMDAAQQWKAINEGDVGVVDAIMGRVDEQNRPGSGPLDSRVRAQVVANLENADRSMTTVARSDPDPGRERGMISDALSALSSVKSKFEDQLGTTGAGGRWIAEVESAIKAVRSKDPADAANQINNLLRKVEREL